MNQQSRPSARAGAQRPPVRGNRPAQSARSPVSPNRPPVPTGRTPVERTPVRRPAKRRRKKRPSALLPVLLLLLIVGITLGIVIGIASRSDSPSPGSETESTQSGHDPSDSEAPLTPPTSTEPEDTAAAPGSNPPVSSAETEAPRVTYTDVTLLSAGDIMFHYDNIQAGYDAASQTYSFLDLFRYLSPVIEKYDFAVGNLETTFSGADKAYTKRNVANFNTPDTGIDAIKSAGFDMMLFANNHTYDRGIDGIKRTVQLLKQNGLACIGAVENKQDAAWKIVDLKGTKIGMLNYTNDGTWSTSASGTLNGNTLRSDHASYINIFYLKDLDGFYARVKKDVEALKSAGADLIVFYIHWGPEYYVEPQNNTKKIAQALCDMGVDAIIGSHPHVIQPAETLTSSSDPNHKTICFYSLGNFLSNQNRKTLSEQYCKGNNKNTENGLMVVLKIRKYSTGQTLITGVETIPTWVHRYEDENGRLDYRIIPLSLALESPEDFGLNDSSFGLSHATEALAMTKDLIDREVAAFNQAISLPNTAA